MIKLNPKTEAQAIRWEKHQLVYDYIKEGEIYKSKQIAQATGLESKGVANSLTWLKQNKFIEYFCNYGSNGRELLIEKKNEGFLINLPIDSLCNICQQPVKKIRNSKHKDLCLQCTIEKFMKPKEFNCFSCNSIITKKTKSVYKGENYCLECVKILKAPKPKKEKIRCKVCGILAKKGICKPCSIKTKPTTCSNCKCVKPKMEIIKLKNINLNFCSMECVKAQASTNERDFTTTTKRLFKQKCALCNYKTIVHHHHILPWSDGGKSTLENCIPVCPNHHAEIHMKLITPEQIKKAQIKACLIKL